MYNDAKKSHPHAENMIEYGKDARATDKPWELWQRKYDWKEGWKNILGHPDWDEEVEYRRKPKEPELIQGYTAEQWLQIIDGKFLCEFSDRMDDSGWVVGPLTGFDFSHPQPFEYYGGSGNWRCCRPLRAKGVKQPWFGGEKPVGSDAVVAVYLRDGTTASGDVGGLRWEHIPERDDIIAFIEL